MTRIYFYTDHLQHNSNQTSLVFPLESVEHRPARMWHVALSRSLFRTSHTLYSLSFNWVFEHQRPRVLIFITVSCSGSQIAADRSGSSSVEAHYFDVMLSITHVILLRKFFRTVDLGSGNV